MRSDDRTPTTASPAREPEIAGLADLCQHATLDEIGSVAYGADIAQMQHETLPTRIFRS